MISARHYYSIWQNAVGEVTDSNFNKWGNNIFELLTRDAFPEDTTAESRRRFEPAKGLNYTCVAWSRSQMTSQFYHNKRIPHELTEIVGNTHALNKRPRILQEVLVQMLEIRNSSAEPLKSEELVDVFCIRQLISILCRL